MGAFGSIGQSVQLRQQGPGGVSGDEDAPQNGKALFMGQAVDEAVQEVEGVAAVVGPGSGQAAPPGSIAPVQVAATDIGIRFEKRGNKHRAVQQVLSAQGGKQVVEVGVCVAVLAVQYDDGVLEVGPAGIFFIERVGAVKMQVSLAPVGRIEGEALNTGSGGARTRGDGSDGPAPQGTEADGQRSIESFALLADGLGG